MQILFCRHLPALPCTAIRVRKPIHCFIAGMAGVGTKQIMRVMKLTAFILLVACLQVSAGANSQTLTLSLKGATLEKVFDEIKKQSGYYFLYEEGLLERARRVDIQAKGASLKQVLDTCFMNQPLTYRIVNKIVVVINKELKDINAVDQDPIDVKGRVTDKDGNPLSGANVKIKGTSIGTTTDQNGNYELKGIDEKAVLEISYVGHEMQVIAVGNKKIINAILDVSMRELDATIIKGYYTTTKRLNTGNVSKVTAETIGQQPVSNVLQALQGRVPGMFITQHTGVPGSGFTVRLRGQNSIANGNDPLYIIDGIPFTSTPIGSRSLNNIIVGGNPMSFIDVSEIESIEILKDADATAIYGSRGANGVILITTKKGKAGKTKGEINFYTGAGKVTRTMDLLNTSEYIQMRREAFANDGATPQAWDDDLVNWDTTHYTDWQELLIGGTANITNANASISGGNSNTQFLIGGRYYKESTVFPGNFANEKSSVYFSLTNTSLNQKFKASLSGSFLSDNNNLYRTDLTLVALTLAPNAPSTYDSNGQLNWGPGFFDNPLRYQLQKYRANTNNLVCNSILSYQLLSSLQFKASLGYTQMNMDEIATYPIGSFPPLFNVKTGSSSFSSNRIKTWLIEPQLIWHKEFGNHKLDILVGTTFQENLKQGETLQAEGYSNDELLDNIAGASTITKSSSAPPYYIQYRYNAIFGRINYNWGDKYLINVTGRRDGSSRFGPGKQVANFGAAGAAWVFSKEKIIGNLFPFLSYGKIRASYGITGNDQLTDYQYLNSYSATTYQYLNSVGLIPSRLFNADFAWETNKKFESAIELGVFQDRIIFTANYYMNRSSNQLVGYPLPLITGASSIQFNLPATVRNNGWEFELNTINIKNKRFSWSSSLNLSVPRNKLIAYPNLEGSSYANTYVVGKSLFIRNKLHFIGVDAETGLYDFEDLDKDGNISFPNDLQPLKEVTQEYFGGFHNNFKYERIELDIFVQFVKQTGLNYLYNFLYAPGLLSNQPRIVLNRWQKPGDISDVQKFTQEYSTVYDAYDRSQSYGDNILSDASFIRLKNISLSYQLPRTWTQRIKMDNCKIYLQGQNLITLTDYEGMDPENQSTGSLPPLRIITAGIKITL